MPAKDEMPSTLERSPKEAQELWATVHDNAVEQYGEGERAHRTVFSALKHSFEKVGDHWEPKAQKGPSDAQAAREGARARQGAETAAASTPTRPKRTSTTWRSGSTSRAGHG
ncbi:MAG TPA: ChaB family protein [Intrasporangium sp.]|nr:ChaB family protein [Intrasporangium sp.]